MWVTKREWARHQRELRAALDRATRAEDALAAERSAKDWAILQLTSRFVVKQGGYGLDSEPQSAIPAPAHPLGYTHEPTDIDMAKQEYYRMEFRKAGRSEEEADAYWEAEMRGESPTPIYMAEGEQ